MQKNKNSSNSKLSSSLSALFKEIGKIIIRIERKSWILMSDEELEKVPNVSGVYLISITKTGGASAIDFKNDNIFYIGASGEIRERLKKFKTAISNGRGHWGANKICNLEKYKYIKDNLNLSNPLKGKYKLFFAYIETDKQNITATYDKKIQNEIIPQTIEHNLLLFYVYLKGSLPELNKNNDDNKKNKKK
ncbi:MAG: hypothetical protein AB1304_07290 [Bacteroidota bacterium]